MKHTNIQVVHIKELFPDPDQPRQDFDLEDLAKLEESISKKGIMTPIVVEPKKDGKYLIIDGERRFRSAIKLKLATVPVNILEKELSPIERNIIRFQLQETHKQWSPFEKAEAMRAIKMSMELTDFELAKALAISIATCKRYLSILSFAPNMRTMLVGAKLPFTYIKNLSYTNNIMPEKILKAVPDFIEMAIRKYQKGVIRGGKDFTIINRLIKSGSYDMVIRFFKDEKYTATQAYLDSGNVDDQLQQGIFTRTKSLLRDLHVIQENKIDLSDTTYVMLNHLRDILNSIL